MALLAAQGLTKRFGGLVALNRLDVRTEALWIHSLIGPNGAGKTTYFNCVTGFSRPEEGEIYFRGASIEGLPSDRVTRRGIARTYQNIRLFANMTVVENVLVGMHPHLTATWAGAILRTPGTRREEAEAARAARDLLDFVEVKAPGDLLAKHLPYGAQRRLEIARALASRPTLLLLDEPAAGMNPRETGELMSFIRRLRDEREVTILLIEHQMRVVMGISDRVTVLDHGTKIAEGTSREVQSDLGVIEAYLGARRAAADAAR